MARYHAPSEQELAHVPSSLAGAVTDPEAWVVGSILRFQGTTAYTSAAVREGFVPPAVKPFLKPVLGACYRAVVRSLEGAGVVECDGVCYRGDPTGKSPEGGPGDH